jgi:hypothetical protein
MPVLGRGHLDNQTWEKTMPYSIHLDVAESKKAAIFIHALVDLAKANVQYSFFISKILWGASLYLYRGSFAEQWPVYDRISDAARAVRDRGQKDWKKQLTFEHCKPLKAIYSDLLKKAENITPEIAIRIIAEYPPVLITRMENSQIASEHKAQGDPEVRYTNARILCSFPLAVVVEEGSPTTSIAETPEDRSRVCPECGQEILDEASPS